MCSLVFSMGALVMLPEFLVMLPEFLVMLPEFLVMLPEFGNGRELVGIGGWLSSSDLAQEPSSYRFR
jgi:hypothetical protein